MEHTTAFRLGHRKKMETTGQISNRQKNPMIPLARFLLHRFLIGQTKSSQKIRSMIGHEQSLMA
jgi:hypothetical protein